MREEIYVAIKCMKKGNTAGIDDVRTSRVHEDDRRR
jgi:hypothetical protein